MTHPPRPPIPLVAFDEAAAAARRRELAPARLGRLADLGAWLAGCAGTSHPPVRARLAAAARPAEGDPGIAAPAGLEVGEVAAAVDAGRALAARAAADGITVLAGDAGGREASVPAICVAGALTGAPPARLAAPDSAVGEAVAAALDRQAEQARGPLGVLRRLGDAGLAVLTGLAVGAGETGLAYVCDGLVATAGAAVAVAVEPGLRPRLIAGHRSGEPAHDVVLEHLGLDPVLDLGVRTGDGTGAMLAIEVLRVAAGLRDPRGAG